MSTRTAFTFVGAAVGAYFPAIGATWGSLIGGWIGSAIDPVEIEGPRVDDTRVTTSAYGLQMPIVYGRQNRVPGNIIWTTGLIESQSTHREGKGGPKVTEYTYRLSCAIALSRGTCAGVRKIWANKKLIWDIAGVEEEPDRFTQWSMVGGLEDFEDFVDSSLIASFGFDYHSVILPGVAFYPGNFTQLPDETIESYLGVGNVPAYRGTAYVVLKNLNLADFGNAMPSFEFELDGVDGENVAAIARDVCVNSGLTVDEFAIDPLLVQATVRGYNVNRASTAAAALLSLQAPGAFDVSDYGGALRFSQRGRGPKCVIEDEYLAVRPAADAGRDLPRLLIARRPDHELPGVVAVTYVDADRDYQTNTQTAERLGTTAIDVQNIDAPVTLSSSEARILADRAMFELWGSRSEVKFAISQRFDFLSATDKVVVFRAGRPIVARMGRLTHGDDGVIEVDAASEDVLAFTGYDVGADAFVPAQSIVDGSEETFIYLFDGPILLPGDSPTGLSWVADSPDATWRGGTLARSADGGTTWSGEGSTSRRTVTGTVGEALGSGSAEIWDEINTILVTLKSTANQLVSLEEASVLAGGNVAWIGDPDGVSGEIIQFRDAIAQSDPGVYLLSGLLRGRRGTEHAIDYHGIGEIFVLLTPEELYTVDHGIVDWNLSRDYVGVSLFQTVDNAPLDSRQSIANTGERSRPRSPVHIEGARDGSNNLTITWVRRSRLNGPWMGYGETPLDEPVEEYEVDIVDGSTVVRTITVSAQTASYTAAEQTADGFTPGDPVSGEVYMISATRGRGHPGAFTV